MPVNAGLDVLIQVTEVLKNINGGKKTNYFQIAISVVA
jgi:hypothetical protein